MNCRILQLVKCSKYRFSNTTEPSAGCIVFFVSQFRQYCSRSQYYSYRCYQLPLPLLPTTATAATSQSHFYVLHIIATHPPTHSWVASFYCVWEGWGQGWALCWRKGVARINEPNLIVLLQLLAFQRIALGYFLLKPSLNTQNYNPYKNFNHVYL